MGGWSGWPTDFASMVRQEREGKKDTSVGKACRRHAISQDVDVVRFSGACRVLNPILTLSILQIGLALRQVPGIACSHWLRLQSQSRLQPTTGRLVDLQSIGSCSLAPALPTLPSFITMHTPLPS